MTLDEMIDQATADPTTAKGHLEELARRAEGMDESTQEYRDIVDASRTLSRLQPVG